MGQREGENSSINVTAGDDYQVRLHCHEANGL